MVENNENQIYDVNISYFESFMNKTIFSKFCSPGNFGLEQSGREISLQQKSIDCKKCFINSRLFYGNIFWILKD